MKRNLNYIIIFTLLLSLFMPIATFAKSDDVKGHYFEHELRSLIKKGILNGYGDGIYKPDTHVTRAEFTALLLSTAESMKLLDPKNKGKASKFSDVTSSDWHYNTINKASEYDLIDGYDNGTFKPDNKITREEMAVILKRTVEEKEPILGVADLHYKDTNKIGKWAIPDLEQFVTTDIIIGSSDGQGNFHFLPQNNVTRGESAAFLNRTINYLDDSSSSANTYTKYPYNFKKMVDTQVNSIPKVDGAGKFTASRSLVSYYANPSNFAIDSSDFYQFLNLSRSTGVPANDLNSKFLKNKGTLDGQGKAFVEAAKTHKINEVYLVSHALHETGNGTSDLAKGIEVGLDKNNKPKMVTKKNRKDLKKIKKTYNMFGIRAVDSNPKKGGSEHAYSEGWFTPHAAIVGGATFISEDYIDQGLDTLYKMRWNPESKTNGQLGKQYATHVQWATIQAKKIHDMYKKLNTYSLAFDIPAFKDAPRPSKLPNGVNQYAVLKSSESTAWTTATGDGLNLRKGPTTGFASIKSLSHNTKVSILGQNGGWYKVKAGKDEGWVAGSYLSFKKLKKASTFTDEEIAPQLEEEQDVEQLEEDVQVIEEIDIFSTDDDNEMNIGTTTHDLTPVYNDADLADAVQTELPKDTDVIILDETELAYQIKIDDITGWISIDALQSVDH